MNKKSGRAGRVILPTGTLYITKWELELTEEYSDSTDTSTYNPTTKKTWKEQVPTTTQAEGDIEGWIDFDTYTSTILAAFKTLGPKQVSFMFDESTEFGNGLFDFTSFKPSSPSEVTISFTAHVKSHAEFTY